MLIAASCILLPACSSSLDGESQEWETLNQEFSTLMSGDRYDEAEVVAEKALVLAERDFGLEHRKTASWLNNLALLFYHMQGRYEEAERSYKRALPLLEKAFGPKPPHIPG